MTSPELLDIRISADIRARTSVTKYAYFILSYTVRQSERDQ